MNVEKEKYNGVWFFAHGVANLGIVCYHGDGIKIVHRVKKMARFLLPF